ncbi:MAG: GAF domain-containing protein, partial [Thiohalobacteraceae bacterium]
MSTHPQIAAGARLDRRQEWLLYGWVLLIVLAPLVLMVDETTFAHQRHVDIRTHSAVEMFCGITALMIATLILVLSRQYQERALKLFATGFLCMGSLDILHALTPVLEHPGLFVGFHTLSTLSGGAFLCAGAARYYLDHNPDAPPLRQSGELLSMLGVLAVVAIAYHLILPPGRLDDLYDFSGLARRTHELSSLLYAGAAVLAFLFFRATRQRLVLIAAGLLLVFSESAYLFRFSHIWDTTWWLWHAVKVGFYIGTLVVIAAGLVVALRAVERARVAQMGTTRQLARAHDALGLVHHELQIRNAMVNASINARTLGQTLQVVESALAKLLGPCHYRLTLRVPKDEVAEWDRDMRRQKLHWEVSVTHDAMPCARLVQAVGGSGDETVHTCTPTHTDHICMCLALRAQDQVFGYLRMQVQESDPARIKYEQLEVIAAEIGPILHNALLHYRWDAAVAFRSALTRIGALLGSTLELPQVLQSVCRESAQLLESEAAALFLAEEQSEQMRLASRCMFGLAADPGGQQPPWVGSAEGAALFARLRETGRSLALVKPESPLDPMPFPLGTEGCQWGALVMFPLFDAGRLMALMIIMRRERVAFSQATVEKGELLAEQVRGAIANARAY